MGDVKDDESRLRSRVLRRWYVAVAGIVATAFLCFAATILVPVTYTAKAAVILTPPATTGVNGSPNPYLTLGGLLPLADVVSRAMTAGPNMISLRAKGVADSFSVATDPTTNSPVLVVTADGPTGAVALQNLRQVLATAPTVLAQMQDAQSVPSSARVHAQVIALPINADAVRKSQIRALVVAMVLGIVATVGAVTITDLLLLRRKRRRVAAVPEEQPSDTGDAGDDIEPEKAAISAFHAPPVSADAHDSADEPSAQRSRGKLLAITALRR